MLARIAGLQWPAVQSMTMLPQKEVDRNHKEAKGAKIEITCMSYSGDKELSDSIFK
jgi:hypothetical protein